MEAKSVEGKKTIRDLRKELADASARQGVNLVWSAAEASIVAQIASVLDRKAELLELYNASPDVKLKLKISAEVRLLESSAARLVRLVKTDLAQPESLKSVKARNAARKRWDRRGAR